MFGRAKRTPITFDKTGKIPVIRASICTGERTAGFRDEATGRFSEVMLIRTVADFQEFLRTFGVSGVEVRREW